MLDPAYTDLTQYRWDATLPSDKVVNSTTNAYWQYVTNVSNKLAPVFNTTNANGAPNGLYSISLGAQVLYGGSYGYWRFTAPGNASVAQVEWTHMSHTAAYAGGPSPCIGYGIIYNTTAWKAAATDCFNFSSSYRRSCWDCNDNDGFSYDPSINGAQFGTEVYNTTAANLSDFLGQTTVFVVDNDTPLLSTTSQPSSAWTDNPTGTFAVTATDGGVGVESMDVPGSTSRVTNTGCLYAGPCPASMSRSVDIPSLNLPDGDNSLTFTAYDASHYDHRDANGNLVPGQHQASTTTHVKIDRQAPTIAAADLSGDLWDRRNQPGDHRNEIITTDTTDLNVTAHDSTAGVRSIDAVLQSANGTTITTLADPTIPQSCDACAKTRTITVPLTAVTDGDYQLIVTAHDYANNASSATAVPFTLDRQGDVQHAELWDGDPGLADSANDNSYWTRANTHQARTEGLNLVSTLGPTPCSTDPGGSRADV